MTPAVTQVETVDYPVFKTIVKWEKRTALNDTHCEERHKEMTSETWHVSYSPKQRLIGTS